MKTWRKWGLALGGIACTGAIVFVGGVLPFKASTGHWAVTEAVLRFGMGRSIWTWSRGTSVPDPLVDPELRVLGAGMYETSCRPCHGAPGAYPRLSQHMLPPAPDFQEQAPRFDARAQFYVVKHGIRLTGMPAWPAPERGDEVAAVVSFLVALPDLDAAEYDALVFGEDGALREPGASPDIEGCARCHDRDAPGVPVLDGQPVDYLEGALRAYRADARQSGAMEPVAALMDDEDISRTARAYAKRPSPAVEPTHEGPGHDIATRGVAERRIAPCVECHASEVGEQASSHPDYPLLLGQDRRYLARQLELFQEERRGGGPFADVMALSLAHGLTDDEIDAVSRWYAGERPSDVE